MKLQTLMIFASDLEKAKRFYSDTLGLDLVSEGADRLVFSFTNGSLVAFKCEKDGSVGDYANEARSVFVFGVSSIESAMEALRKDGVRFLHESPAQNEWGRYVAFVDPFNNVHELFEERAV